jgi:hypothetical protein
MSPTHTHRQRLNSDHIVRFPFPLAPLPPPSLYLQKQLLVSPPDVEETILPSSRHDASCAGDDGPHRSVVFESLLVQEQVLVEIGPPADDNEPAGEAQHQDQLT